MNPINAIELSDITKKFGRVAANNRVCLEVRWGEILSLLGENGSGKTTLMNILAGIYYPDSGKVFVNGNEVTIRSPKDISCINEEGIKILDNISFTAYSGEILGIAGISGCGQKELLEGIAGLHPITQDSSVLYFPDSTGESTELVGKRPIQIRKLGVALSFVPEDRLGMGLVGSMDMADNMMLRSYLKGKLGFTDRKPPRKLAEDVIEQLEVVTPGVSTPISRLSGGNVQKVLVGREIAAAPKVLMTAYAVRGLDINTSYTIYSLLNDQKKAGVAVIYVGEDLDVLLELCDRILVLCGGKVSGIVDGRSTTKEEVGLLMTSLREEEKK